jgi:hypothetical protein
MGAEMGMGKTLAAPRAKPYRNSSRREKLILKPIAG